MQLINYASKMSQSGRQSIGKSVNSNNYNAINNENKEMNERTNNQK